MFFFILSTVSNPYSVSPHLSFLLPLSLSLSTCITLSHQSLFPFLSLFLFLSLSHSPSRLFPLYCTEILYLIILLRVSVTDTFSENGMKTTKVKIQHKINFSPPLFFLENSVIPIYIFHKFCLLLPPSSIPHLSLILSFAYSHLF